MNKPRIAYILATYPSRSETFIQREIEALHQYGLIIDLYALRAGEGTAPRDVLYRNQIPFLQKLVALLWAVAHPLKFLQAVYLLLDDFLSGGRATCLLKSLRNLPAGAYFARRIRDSQADYIHAHFAGQPTVIARTISLLVTIPYTFSVHANDIFVDNAPLVSTIVQANAVAACTRAAADHLKTLVPADQHSKIRVVHHGIAAGDVDYTPRSSMQILAVGRLVEKKGYAVLLKALSLLAGDHPNLQCKIVGDGPLRTELERLATESDLVDRVEFTGWLPPEEVRQQMQTAGVLAVPSIKAADGDRDGLPNVILEAAAAGLPVVASEVPGIDEFVTDGQTGLLAKPGDPRALADALHTGLTDEQLRVNLARAARKKVVEEFDVQANAGKLIEAMNWQ